MMIMIYLGLSAMSYGQAGSISVQTMMVRNIMFVCGAGAQRAVARGFALNPCMRITGILLGS